MRTRVQSLALLSALRIHHCCEALLHDLNTLGPCLFLSFHVPPPFPQCTHSLEYRMKECVHCGVGRRCGSDPELLWLWCRLAAAAPIHLLAWELPYAMGEALKRQNKTKQKSRKKFDSF